MLPVRPLASRCATKTNKRRPCLRKLSGGDRHRRAATKSTAQLAESFAANFTAELDNAGLAHGAVEWFAAPRRLALKVANLAASQPDREVENAARPLPAFDAEGKPSKAAEGWARGCGITVDQAERLTTDKGEWLLYRAHVKGKARKRCCRTWLRPRWLSCRSRN